MKAKLKQTQNERDDLSFLSNQKDLKIQELDKIIVEL